MPERPLKTDRKSGPQMSPEVYAFSGKPKGTFDPTHVTGSATEHGVGGDKAVDHGLRVRNIVELVGEPVITTDSIRYILDGLRRIEPGEPATESDLRRFRDHIRENTARLEEKLQEQRGEQPVDVDFGTLTESDVDLSDAARKQLLPLITMGFPDHFVAFKQRDCRWDVLSRSMRRFTEIFPPIYDETRIVDRQIDSTQTTEQVRELKFVLKHSLSSEITLESLGITSTAGIDSEATHQEIENIVVSSSWTMILWTVTLDILIRARRRFDVTERWGWIGEDCII